MSQSPVTVTYSLEEVLSRIEGKIDGLKKEVSEIRQKDLADLRVGQARLETEVKTEIAGINYGMIGNTAELRVLRIVLAQQSGKRRMIFFTTPIPDLSDKYIFGMI